MIKLLENINYNLNIEINLMLHPSKSMSRKQTEYYKKELVEFMSYVESYNGSKENCLMLSFSEKQIKDILEHKKSRDVLEIIIKDLKAGDNLEDFEEVKDIFFKFEDRIEIPIHPAYLYNLYVYYDKDIFKKIYTILKPLSISCVHSEYYKSNKKIEHDINKYNQIIEKNRKIINEL